MWRPSLLRIAPSLSEACLRCLPCWLLGPICDAEPCGTRAEETAGDLKKSGGFGFELSDWMQVALVGAAWLAPHLSCKSRGLQFEFISAGIYVSPVQVTLEPGAHPSSLWVDPASARS